MAFKKKSKRVIYEQLLNQYRPTIRSTLLEILRIKLFNLQKGKQPIIKDGATFVPEEDKLKDLPLRYIALIENDTVVEMIRINEQTAGMLLNKKVKLVEFDPKKDIVKKGIKYIDKQFVLGRKNENEKKS